MTDQTDTTACNITGHDYDGQWRLYGYFATTTMTTGRSKFRVTKKETARCRKCDKAETKEAAIGHFRVTDNDELEMFD